MKSSLIVPGRLRNLDLFQIFSGTTYGGSQARGLIEAAELAYTIATALHDLRRVCDLHHSSWQHWIHSPLSDARDQTCILMDTSQVHFC